MARSKSPSVRQTSHEKSREEVVGVTLMDKDRFLVPETPSTVDSLVKKWYSLPSLTTFFFFLVSIYATFYLHQWSIIGLSIFWRLAYDLGLGAFLHYQSTTGFFTTMMESAKAKPYTRKILNNVIHSAMGPGHSCFADKAEVPAAYTAWILFRFLVNVILPNDVFAFCLAAYRYSDFNWVNDHCNWSENICLDERITIPLGAAVIISSLLSKVSAHQILGNYAWFWGDFFFRIDQELIFNGIFELFPHPMYTIGYGWAYVVGLLSKSYIVLALAMSSHLLHLIFFLQLVETPHIEKLYGAESLEDGAQEDKKKKASNVFIVKNFDKFRTSDVDLLLITGLLIAAVLLGSWNENSPLASDEFFIFLAIFFRTVATTVFTYVLVRQEKDQFWTRHWTDTMHSTKEQAFEEWKRFYNLFTTLQHISFLLCCYRLFQSPPLEEIFSGFFLARVIFALMLWGLTYWSFSSTFETLGDFGWFYGDFFLDPPEHAQLTYTGIYRYINNPDVYLGHIWMYSCAILCSSWALFCVGFAAQSFNIVFLQVVEKPHLRAIYSNKVRPYSTAMEKVIKMKAGEFKEKTVKRVGEMKEKTAKKVEEIMQKMGT